MQERLQARQATYPDKDLSDQIEKALDKYHDKERDAQTAIKAADSDNNVRSAFVVFQRTNLADDVIRRSPRGAHRFWLCGLHDCA